MKNKAWIFLIIVLVVASFFRLWQLDLIPPGLYPDVAINGNDALETLKSGQFKVFYPENNGREGLFIWLTALSFSVFGVSAWSIKIVAALIGILTVLGLYLLARELFNKNVALLSSFFLTVSFWHTDFSRIGFRGILVPFVLTFAFYFLFRGFRIQKAWNFIIAGIFLGLGFYTYISFRMAALLLLTVLILWWLIYKRKNLQKQFIIHASLLMVLIFIVALPIGLYFFQNPQDFASRAAPVSIFSAENPIKELGKSLALHLGMFNFYGDNNWRHNFAGSPQLFWPIGVLFLLGLLISIKDLFSGWKKKDCSTLCVPCFMLSWFFIMLLPGVLTHEGIPHSLRVIGVIPAVYIFAGLGGWWIYEKLKPAVKSKRLFIVICLLFLFSVGYSGFNKYFCNWAVNPNVKGAFTERFVDIGNYLNSLPSDAQKYVIVNEPGVAVPLQDGIPMPAQTIMFIENSKYGSLQSKYILPENLDQIKIVKDAVIVPMKYDQNLFNELEIIFPQGEIKKINEIVIYEIK